MLPRSGSAKTRAHKTGAAYARHVKEACGRKYEHNDSFGGKRVIPVLREGTLKQKTQTLTLTLTATATLGRTT